MTNLTTRSLSFSNGTKLKTNPKSASLKSLERYLANKEYLKILQAIGNHYEDTAELFLLVEAYIGLGRFDLTEKLLIDWQSNLSNSEEWAYWCYLYAKSLSGLRNKVDALTTLNFAGDFLKSIQNEELSKKVETLRQELV